MKASRYNFSARTPAGSLVLFNGATNAMLEFAPDEAEDWLRGIEDPDTAPAQIARWLQAGGFIVPRQRDEVADLVSRAQQAQVVPDLLDLKIITTYQCNFRCTYCAVDFVQGVMTDDAAQRVAAFVERQIGQFQQANITWYGGEPMLSHARMCDLAAQFRDIGRSVGVPVLQFVATNGYLLTADRAAQLVAAGVEYFHVTIDGNPESHNSTRVLRSGRGTYDRILANFLAVRTEVPEARLTLRLNLESETVGTAGELLGAIPPELRAGVQVHAAPIKRDARVLPEAVLGEIRAVAWQAQSLGYDFYDNVLDSVEHSNCVAELSSSFHVGPDGRLDKCSPSGKPEARVGRISEQGVPVFTDALDVWNAVPQVTQACADCEFLCFCVGGCRVQRLRGSADPTCRDQYAGIEASILTKWRHRKPAAVR